MSAPANQRTRLILAGDVAVVVLALAAGLLFLVGQYRDVFGGVVVSIGWIEAIFAAAAVGAIRHAARPRPSILDTIREWRAAIRSRPALADAVACFWLTRPAVLLIGFLAVVTIGLPGDGNQPNVPGAPLRLLPARWDAQWYASVAALGYEWRHRFDRQQNLAFFPAYPMLIRGVGTVAGAFQPDLPPERQLARLTWSGLLISLAAFFWASWYFARLARELLDEDRARHALVLLAAYPFALFFSAAYTESVFLLAALATWHYFRRGHPAAAAWGLLAGLVRPNGCFLSVPLGLIAIGVRDPGDPAGGSRHSAARRLILAATPGIGMLLFTAYLYSLTGIWFAWSRMHEAWGRVFGGSSFDVLTRTITRGNLLDLAVSHPYDVINGIGLVFAVALIWPVWRRLGAAWCAFVAINVLAPLSAGGLLSMGRLTATLFPLFIALAAVLPPRRVPAVAVGFAIVQGLLAALFYTWRGVY